MTEREYEAFLLKQSDRKKELLPYESFVRRRLEEHRDTPAAQMHDWLKEHYRDFPKVDPKTVYNFVHWVRNKYELPIVQKQRQYQIVEELPYGFQAQVDFGTYNMRTSTHSRIKVYFFVMTLSRSRYKFIWFISRPFNSELAVHAHELAFQYFGGNPEIVVYDQDKVFLVSENNGDFILTDVFRAYVREQSFKLHFCRKSDPESKGKVENVVKYVKQNFLYNRTYYNNETLNEEAMGWLGRTANALSHGVTKKEPCSEIHQERSFLKAYTPYSMKVPPVTYTVRKDNTICWKGNFYSLPLGTYTGSGCLVAVRAEEQQLIIQNEQATQELCRHKIPTGKGLKVINTDHKRDKSKSIEELMVQLCNQFENKVAAYDWFNCIRTAKPRYIRDQLLMIREIVETIEPATVNSAMIFCHQNDIVSATDFKAIIEQQMKQSRQKEQDKTAVLNPLSGNKGHTLIEPKKSSIQDYQQLMEK